METINEIRRKPIFKDELVFFWSELFCCQQKPLLELGVNSLKQLILASGQLIFWPVEIMFFSIFQRLLTVIVFFRLVETSFSMKPFIETESVNQLVSGNGFSGQWWKLISFVQRFFLLAETVTKIIESQFLRKDDILTNVTDFLASGNQLLPFFQKAVNCYQWKQLLLQLEQIFQPIIHSVQQK